MGEEFYKYDVKIKDNTIVNSNTILSGDLKDDISFLCPSSSNSTIEFNSDQHIEYLKQIQKHLFLLTKSTSWEELNTEINDQVITKVAAFIDELSNKLSEEMSKLSTHREQLKTSLAKKLQNDHHQNLPIFGHSSIDLTSESGQNIERERTKQLSYFAIQSLISIILILIKSAEKNDRTIIQQILTLTGQLCEQLPMKCLFSTNNLLFKSIEPLTNYITELSSSTDPIIANQTVRILLSFSLAKGSFKDLLPLLHRLIFNTTETFNVHGLISQMNNNLTETIKQHEEIEGNSSLISLNYLKTMNVYPTPQLNEESFTGEFLSSIILSHLDIENSIESNFSSITCEFHPNTFKTLFTIIEQLASSSLTDTTSHILTICLRLFATHLQMLVDVRSQINLTEYAPTQWLELFLKLSCDENSSSIAKEASKVVVNLLNVQSSGEKFLLIHRYLIENKHPILIEELLVELNKTETLFNWIDTFHDENDKLMTLTSLYSLMDLYFHQQYERKSQLEKILLQFQYFLLLQLMNHPENNSFLNREYKISSFIIEYLTYIFKQSCVNNLFNSVLLGLYLMTDIQRFLYEDIEPIFISILPSLAEYHLKNPSNQFIACLIGRICQVLIIGSPQDSLETQHLNKLKLPFLSSGCLIKPTDDLLKSNLAIYSQLILTHDMPEDRDFLMLIHQNTNEGAQLISKLKSSSKSQLRPLQKSIEDQANNACAAIFAVYLKYYRQIHLAKSELSKTDETKPSDQLLSLYENANRVQTVFATTKGQGGDCDELLKQIQIRTLFLLSTVKESGFIPKLKEDLSPIGIKTKEVFHFHRQRSHWSKARTILKLLKNLFQACLRFKNFMLEKKQLMEDKNDFNRTLDQFISGDKLIEIDELEKCLQRQHQRAIVRLLTYRFIRKFFQDIHVEQNPEMLTIYLPYLRKNDPDWSYFDQIHSSNIQLKNKISRTYYSIIKFILPLTLQSNHLAQNLFYLLCLSHQSIDFHYQLLAALFSSFVSYQNSSEESNKSLYLQFTAFNWFRLYVMKLSEYIDIDKLRNVTDPILQQEERLAFHSCIFNEIKSLKGRSDSDEQRKSFQDISLAWFLQVNESVAINDLYLYQYLAFLLRTIRFYKNVPANCATGDYLQELLDLYHHYQSNVTRFLVIKLLRYLIPHVSDTTDGIVRNRIEKFLLETLNTIGENKISSEILAELIYMYRTIMSTISTWQSVATDLVFHSIQSYLNLQSIENNDSHAINQLIASLSILGGDIESYHLGSLITIEMNEEPALAFIIKIDETEKPYTIQYFENNQIESMSIDKLQLQIDVPPTNCNDSILDTLGNFIQIDSTESNALMLLQLKRRSLSVLSHLLNNQKSIEIFMNKPYAPILAKLCLLTEKVRHQPKDLQLFNRRHLEQYCLSLDQCQIIEEKDHSIPTTDSEDLLIWNTKGFPRDQAILDALAIPVNGWKSYASESEIELLGKGRIGDEEICIVPMPRNTVDLKAIEECGNKHRFRGRIAPDSETAYVSFPTFVLDHLRLTKGKWYYCVRLPVGRVVQIGWATDGFSPGGGIGVGDDLYSWSYDGSRAVFFYGYEQEYNEVFDNLRWKEKDVCGCGIEISGNQTNIKYWLNGKFLGTAFAHNTTVAGTSTICDLLPNGPTTSFYPSVTVQWAGDPLRCCELIVSPEDMQDCPLPDGYKPLLLPKLVRTENAIVQYPFHAYLIGDKQKDFCLRTRSNDSNKLLRDFVHEQHLPTAFDIEDHHLILPERSTGLLLDLDTHEISSLTISFDFQILSVEEQLHHFPLLKMNSTEISWKKSTVEKQQCAIIFLIKEQQIKVYINNQCQTFDHHEFHSTVYILLNVSARLQNLAIWKYALSDEQMTRLFTYGLFYIANDDQQLKEYRKRVNRISFAKNQQQFTNGLLVPFDQPFNKTIWEKKKEQVDDDEAKYFKAHEDCSTVDLTGNKTYLVLNKSDENWTSYSFALDILVPSWPKSDEIITLFSWNSQTTIYLDHQGQLHLKNREGSSTITPNEYFRLFISTDEKSFQIYLNEKLEIVFDVTNDHYQIESNRIDLFRESNLTENTTDESTLRVSLKSVTYLDRWIPIEQLKSPRLMVPPLETILPNLIAMGFRKNWIESLIEQNQTSDIPRMLWEQKEVFIKTDLDNERERYRKIFNRLNPSIRPEILEELLLSSKFDTIDQIIDLSQRFSVHLLSSPPSDSPIDKSELSTKWIEDKSNTDDNIYQLLPPNESATNKTQKSIIYSLKNPSANEYLESRIACEHGLTMIYARSTLLHMLEVWSGDGSTIFPLEKFTDYSVIKLFDQDEKIDRIYSLIKSILQTEIKELLEYGLLESKVPLFSYLHQDILQQSIQIVMKPSLIDRKNDEEIDHQLPNPHFMLKILKLFTELLSELEQQHEIDLLIAILFPASFIQLLFHLYLLIPIYQSKISILHLFTTLIRIGDHFILHESMQQFFLQCLIELSSNTLTISSSARKKLQLALTDLIFVLITKSESPIEEYRSKLSKNIQALFTMIDVIHAWTDPTKQKLLPQGFLDRSDFLGHDQHLNQDEFKKSNAHFNTNADQELIDLLNKKSSMDDLQSLPNESEPNPTFYKTYTALSNIPADSIQLRAKFMYLLDAFAWRCFLVVDPSLPPKQSFLTDRIRTIKPYLLSALKFDLLKESLEKTKISSSDEWHVVQFDTVKASTETENSESTMFYQAYQQLRQTAHILFRQSNDQLWHAQYIGMHSTDQGGPYRDSITRICSDICSTRLSLFILCPNGRTNVGLNRDCWIPNVYPPKKSIGNQIQKQYRFVGQLLGMAIRKKHYLDMKFPTLFWKRLLQEPITVEDIEAIDIQSFTIINEMEKNIEQIQSSDMDHDMESFLSSIMSDLRFDVVSSSGQTYELLPGGTDIPITSANFKQYCSCYRQYRLNEFNRQLDLIRQGLLTIIPSYYLNLLTAKDLEEAVCGKGQIDIEFLKRNTAYGWNYNSDSPVIQRFWTVLNDMFTSEQRKLFLIFVWGRSTLPSRDEDFQYRFTINSFDVSGDNVDQTLPRAHTCFFMIDLPAYSTSEIMCERLNYAMTYCSSIDGDGNMNDALPEDLFDTDDLDQR